MCNILLISSLIAVQFLSELWEKSNYNINIILTIVSRMWPVPGHQTHLNMAFASIKTLSLVGNVIK